MRGCRVEREVRSLPWQRGADGLTMISRMKATVAQLVSGMAPSTGSSSNPSSGAGCHTRFPYSRPPFLFLSPEEAQRAVDHNSRPILVPGQGRKKLLPWDTGYAEVINAGKSPLNEDQATREVVVVESRSQKNSKGAKAVNEDSDKDKQIEKERNSSCIVGGCCALAVIYILGKIYVANAGDSRAILIRNGEVIPLSNEFTPESERQRLQYLGYLQPHLLGNEFTHLEFPRRIQHREIGRKMLFRDYSMTGWAYKTIEEDDLKFPLVYGEGKKARVMATIGVTRGLGDHDLKVHCSNIHIKPFLSCMPEVKVYDVKKHEHSMDDVIVMGTDGLWDVVSDREVADTVIHMLSNCDPDDPNRFTLAAQDLVMKSRGVLKDHGWRLSNDRLGSGDDISVFVIPLYGHT
ncbi:protein phosphatase 1H-like isoform X3 [Hypanus sabinus]|uniref:protein phosphatase 1H-like isoform X3 n=1 Tax=Hypanus sabinus TaxID=79690 RepID=UPI0028C43B11|nr:protein phosphatase 1H-like isoform X3 [Hypanus sabinus]